jgi:predicted Zn-dependent protease
MDAGAAVRAYRPADPTQVVLRLEQLRTPGVAAASDRQALIRQVDALVEAGARSGKERYYGYAEQVLQRANDVHDPQIAIRHARLLQHKHEFAEAERMLGEILQLNGRDREARLMRAQVRLHLHEPQQALADCTTLLPLVDLLTSTTCIAQARAALGDLRRAQDLLLRVLDSQRGDDATRSWSAGVAAEFAARLGDANAAGRWYRESFELDPQSHYARITYADWLLSAGRFDEASRVASRGASLADRARVVLASRDAMSDDAQRLQLAWQEADARGERAHLRDRARFELLLLHDPAKASASARASLQDRNEADDALILVAAAVATRDRESLQAVRTWQQRYRYEDVRLESLLGALR